MNSPLPVNLGGGGADGDMNVGSGGLDPRIPKIYNTRGLWLMVSEIWPPPWSKVGVGLALEIF